VKCELAVFKPEGVIDDSTKISISKRILLGVEPSGAAALEGALKFILRRL
jgi:hypothetical protein